RRLLRQHQERRLAELADGHDPPGDLHARLRRFELIVRRLLILRHDVGDSRVDVGLRWKGIEPETGDAGQLLAANPDQLRFFDFRLLLVAHGLWNASFERSATETAVVSKAGGIECEVARLLGCWV